LIGRSLAHYHIQSAIGAGGMGEVYRAKDPRLGREVAIKVLPESLAQDRDRLARFESEARSASALNHPNIITIHEIGSANGTAFIAMEFVDGASLRELLASGPIAGKRMLDLAVQIADGLAKAHSAGIVHRDLKPENVMVSKDGFVKLLDFGLAKPFVAPGSGDGSAYTAFLATLNGGCFAGQCDWRLPTIAELLSAAEPHCSSAPCFDPIFGITTDANYWSSTSVAGTLGQGWELDMFFNTTEADRVSEWTSDAVLAVRGGL